jgi:glycosyltransferase involved in cell wall biosynthesis
MPRVAYFPDSFHEVNGVAHTSRHFEAFARRRDLPFLCVRAALSDSDLTTRHTGQTVPKVSKVSAQKTGKILPSDASEMDLFAHQTVHFARHDRQGVPKLSKVSVLELDRSFASFPLDKDLRYDPFFFRHLPKIARKLRAFQPDLIHITGPSELGMIGALLAHHLHIPLVASWHTNVHEYLARRSHVLLSLFPATLRNPAAAAIEHTTLAAAALFYAQARLLFAPNPELCRLLEAATHRPCALMPRGVDADLFSPVHRTRPVHDKAFILGFVGRLSVEKNIRLLATIHNKLIALGLTEARFLIIGQGVEESWLREHLPSAIFPGVLRGPALAEAYANMDCFVFPSHTDTFGNVVLEALASGVPAIVTPDGGPAHFVRQGVTGYIVEDEGFAPAIASLLRDPQQLASMRLAARAQALQSSWDSVFDGVYREYAQLVQQ